MTCLTSDQFADVVVRLESNQLPHSSSLLSIAQKDDLIHLKHHPFYIPPWAHPMTPRTRRKLARLRSDARRKYVLRDGVLYRKAIIDERKRLLLQATSENAAMCIVNAHVSLNHAAPQVTFEEIKRTTYGITRSIVLDVLLNCLTCTERAASMHDPNPQPKAVVRALERVQVDVLDLDFAKPGQKKWLLHIRDHFSQYSMLYALEDIEASSIAEKLEEFVKYYDAPEIIQTNNLLKLVGAVAILCKHMGNQIVLGVLCQQPSRDAAERANRVVKACISDWMMENKSDDWVRSLTSVIKTMNGRRCSHPLQMKPQELFRLRASITEAWPSQLYSTHLSDLLQLVEESDIDIVSRDIGPWDLVSLLIAQEIVKTWPMELSDSLEAAEELEKDLRNTNHVVAYTRLRASNALTTQEVRQRQTYVRDKIRQAYTSHHLVETASLAGCMVKVKNTPHGDIVCKVVNVIDQENGPRYKLQTPLGMLWRLYSTEELIRLPKTVNEYFISKTPCWPTHNMIIERSV